MRPELPPTSFVGCRAARVDLARQRFFDEGLLPTWVATDAVFQSWSRCLRLHHRPSELAVFEPVTASRAHLALQKNRLLLQAWLEIAPKLEAVLGATSCAAMLTDPTGVIIGASCAGRAHEELMPVATRVDVNLSLEAVGTTAPGVVARSLLGSAGLEEVVRSDVEVSLGASVSRLASLPPVAAALLTLPNGLLVWARAEMRSPDGPRNLVTGLALHASGVLAAAPPTLTAAVANETATELPPPATAAGERPPRPCVTAAGHPAGRGAPPDASPSTLRESDLELIVHTLRDCGGNVSRTARLLGVSRNLIYRRLRSLDAEPKSAAHWALDDCSQTEQLPPPSQPGISPADPGPLTSCPRPRPFRPALASRNHTKTQNGDTHEHPIPAA